MHICIYMHIQTYIHTYTNTYTHTYTNTYIQTYTHPHSHTYTHSHLPHTELYSYLHACIHAQLHPTVCEPTDCSPPGSPVHGLSWQDYRSGLPSSPPGDLPNPGIKPISCIGRWILHHLGHLGSPVFTN